MKKGSILVNVARGGQSNGAASFLARVLERKLIPFSSPILCLGIVDEKALEKALREGWIGGAGVDVSSESDLSSRLVRLSSNTVADPPSFSLSSPYLQGLVCRTRPTSRVRNPHRQLSAQPHLPSSHVRLRILSPSSSFLPSHADLTLPFSNSGSSTEESAEETCSGAVDQLADFLDGKRAKNRVI